MDRKVERLVHSHVRLIRAHRQIAHVQRSQTRLCPHEYRQRPERNPKTERNADKGDAPKSSSAEGGTAAGRTRRIRRRRIHH
jgi:hypothetical protein